MNCIRKDIIVENEQIENIKLEKVILFQVDHPFIVNMHYVLQNDLRINFIMKFIKGGSCCATWSRSRDSPNSIPNSS
jgi:hypothetical protein